MNELIGLIFLVLAGGSIYMVTFISTFVDQKSNWGKNISILLAEAIFIVFSISFFILSLAFFLPGT